MREPWSPRGLSEESQDPCWVQLVPWEAQLSARAAAGMDFRAQQVEPLVSYAPCSWRPAKTLILMGTTVPKLHDACEDQRSTM